MYPFGRPIQEEEQPFAAPRPGQNGPVWYSWSVKSKIVFVAIILIPLILVLGVTFFLEEKYPVHTWIGTTPVPPSIFLLL